MSSSAGQGAASQPPAPSGSATGIGQAGPSNSNEPSRNESAPPAAKKKRRGKRRKPRRQSFAPTAEESANGDGPSSRDVHHIATNTTPMTSFYGLGPVGGGGNLSDTSLDSQALLDHRYGYQLHNSSTVSNII